MAGDTDGFFAVIVLTVLLLVGGAMLLKGVKDTGLRVVAVIFLVIGVFGLVAIGSGH